MKDAAKRSTKLSAVDRELITELAAILDALGPFRPKARREEKWRTTEQLANDLFDRTEKRVTLDSLTDILTRYEVTICNRIAQGLPPDAVIRRATYPDRTTALPLWGSTRHHEQPWAGQAPANRLDEPIDVPAGLEVPPSAPHVFLSHTRQDTDLALRLARDLARMGLGSWMFEMHIEQRGPIAACVRLAITTAERCLALVTRDSIASLWVLTELHTAMQAGRPITLVIDADDAELMRLLESVRFSHERPSFDLSVLYDTEPLAFMSADYAERHPSTRAQRYGRQVHDFLATLPLYLSRQSALSYPSLPASWHGLVRLTELAEFPRAKE